MTQTLRLVLFIVLAVASTACRTYIAGPGDPYARPGYVVACETMQDGKEYCHATDIGPLTSY